MEQAQAVAAQHELRDEAGIDDVGAAIDAQLELGEILGHGWAMEGIQMGGRDEHQARHAVQIGCSAPPA